MHLPWDRARDDAFGYSNPPVSNSEASGVNDPIKKKKQIFEFLLNVLDYVSAVEVLSFDVLNY